MASAARILELAELGDGGCAVWLDELVFNLASERNRDAGIRVFANDHDFTNPGIQRLARRVDGLPGLRISVENTEITMHGEIAAFFHSNFLPRVAAAEFALPQAPITCRDGAAKSRSPAGGR